MVAEAVERVYSRIHSARVDIDKSSLSQCLSLELSNFDTAFEVDQKFIEWEGQVPKILRWRYWYSALPSGHILADSVPVVVVRQSYLLNTWYLCLSNESSP